MHLVSMKLGAGGRGGAPAQELSHAPGQCETGGGREGRSTRPGAQPCTWWVTDGDGMKGEDVSKLIAEWCRKCACRRPWSRLT